MSPGFFRFCPIKDVCMLRLSGRVAPADESLVLLRLFQTSALCWSSNEKKRPQHPKTITRALSLRRLFHRGPLAVYVQRQRYTRKLYPPDLMKKNLTKQTILLLYQITASHELYIHRNTQIPLFFLSSLFFVPFLLVLLLPAENTTSQICRS